MTWLSIQLLTRSFGSFLRNDRLDHARLLSHGTPQSPRAAAILAVLAAAKAHERLPADKTARGPRREMRFETSRRFHCKRDRAEAIKRSATASPFRNRRCPCRYRRTCRARQSTRTTPRRLLWYTARIPAARRAPSAVYPSRHGSDQGLRSCNNGCKAPGA